MKKWCALIVLAALSLGAGLAQEYAVYGEGWGYLVEVPPGFALDGASRGGRGVQRYFLDEAEAYVSRTAVLSISALPGPAADPAALAAADLSDLTAGRPGLRATAYRDFGLGDLSVARTWKVEAEAAGYYALRGYAAKGRAGFIFSLEARSPGLLARYEGAFAALLESFVFLSED